MPTTRLRLVRLAALALVLAACGGRPADGDATPTTPADPGPATPPRPSTVASPEPPASLDPIPPPDDPPSTPSAPEDSCEGERLARGECTCAFTRCFDQCCPEGWICIHPSRPGGASKCRRPPR